MKKILLAVLILTTSLLLLTSCAIIDKLLPSETPPADEVAFDSASLKFPSRTFTYDGNARGLTVTGELPEGISVEYENNNCTDAGVYTVTAKFYRNGEYIEGEDLTATLTVKPANYDMSGVIFESKTFEYTGETYTPVIEGELPEGVTVQFVYDGPIKDAGTYTVTAKFVGDSNHNKIPAIKVTYTVNFLQFDMSGVKFEDKYLEYNGEKQYLLIEGTLPEGVSVEYKNNGHTEEGEYAVEAVFTTSVPNYAAPKSMTATLYITPVAMHPAQLVYELTEAGTYEVVGCSDDNPHIIIPATYKSKRVTSIKSGAFEGNTNITLVNIPVTVTNIGNKAFKGCTSLEEIILRGEITVIGYQAFANTSIKSLVLPDTLLSIGQGALMGMPLETLTLPFIGGSANSSNDYLGYLFGATSYSGNAATVPATLKSIVMSDAATKIPAFAFFGISSLEEVKIGSSVGFIGNSAFFGTSLKSIYIPTSVISIPADARAENSPFFGLSSDMVIMLEGIATEGYGKYWNAVADGKNAITIYMKTYEYYLENKENIKDANISDASISAIIFDGKMLDGFSSEQLEYTVEVDVNKGYPNVTAITNSPTSVYTVEQASAENGGTVTVAVVSADHTSTLTYKVKFNLVGDFNTQAEVVGKNGTTGTVTFVLDDGDHYTADFTKVMMNKYDGLKFTYAILTNRLASLNTVYDPTVGKYVYQMTEDGKYTYTVKQDEVDFWNDLLKNYNTEVISHTHTHAFWGINDDGGVQEYIDDAGNVRTSGNLPVGSVSAEIYGSKQIVEELLGIRALTHTVPGIGAKTSDVLLANGTLYKTYYTYYKQLLNQAISNGEIINLIGNVMGVSTASVDKYVTKDNIKSVNGVSRMMVRPTDDTDLWKKFIDNAADNNGWATYCIHKIAPSPTTGHYILESDAEDLFTHALSRNVWIANYTEAALYYAEWASANVSAVYDAGKITIELTDSEDNSVYDEALTVKASVPASWKAASANGETLDVHKAADGTQFVYINIVPDSGAVEIYGA